MEDEEEFESEEVELDSTPARLIDVVVYFFIFLVGCSRALTEFMESLLRLVAEHANHKTEQAAFAEEVRADLESIPKE